jgi:hypothetical protein
LATLERLLAAGRITQEEAAEIRQSANAFEAAQKARLAAAIEGITLREAQSVLASPRLGELQAAYQANQPAIVTNYSIRTRACRRAILELRITRPMGL